MDGKAPTKPGEQKVTNQRAGWKTPVLLMLCLLQAANALKGPRLVSGELGGSVTIQCRYAPLLINSHQRKYWCRLSPRPWLCHTVVSTNHYTQRHYHGRVSLTDFPQKGFFVVRLSQLSPEDVGRYRCGIGNSNDMLFFSMNLTVSAGLSRTIPTATPAASEPNMGSSETASPAANRWTRGTIQTIERQGTGWDSVTLTLDTSKTTALAKGRQTPEATVTIAPGTGGQVGGPIWATVPTPLSPASTIKSVSSTTKAAKVWGTRSSDANRTRASRRERATTTGADGQRGETQRVSTALHTAGKVIGTIRPSNWVLEKWMWTTLHGETLVSKPQALDSIEGTTPAAVVWTLGPTSIEMASAEGSGEGDLDTPAGDGGPQATPSQALAAGPLGPPGKDSSMKSVPLEGTSISRVLAPLSTMLFLLTLAALVLLRRKLQRKRNSQEIKKSSKVTLIQMTQSPELSVQPDLLAQVGRKLLQDDPPHLHAA